LKNRDDVFAFFSENKPRYVVLAAAKVGGILANNTYPVDFLSDNLRIQVNVLDAAREYGVERLLFLGSSCIYPKFAEQPIREDSLLTGHLEPTNDAYAIAKSLESCRSKPSAGSMGFLGFPRCRPIFMAPVTTSPQRIARPSCPNSAIRRSF
jgi:hypothetical protein